MKYSALKTSLLTLAALLLIPSQSFAAQRAESLYEYVSSVFTKMQNNWEQQTYNHRLTNSLLTFVVNEDGKLISTDLKKAPEDAGSADEVLDYLKKAAPFGKLPSHMTGSQLAFTFKFAPDSLQMVGYQILEQKQKPTMLAPVDYQALDKDGGVPQQAKWTDPTAQTHEEQVMGGYIAEVQGKIKHSWKLPQDYPFQRAIALIQIDRNGHLLGAHLTESSGDRTVDKAALEAIYEASPFAPVPTAFRNLPVQVEYIFDPYHAEAPAE